MAGSLASCCLVCCWEALPRWGSAPQPPASSASQDPGIPRSPSSDSGYIWQMDQMELGLEKQESQEAASLGDRDARNWESNSLHSQSPSFMRNLAGVLPQAVRYRSWEKPQISTVSHFTLILITLPFFGHFVHSGFFKISVAHQIYVVTPLVIFSEKSGICVIFSTFQITYALSSLAISL